MRSTLLAFMENIRTRPLSTIEGQAWRRWLPQALVLLYLLAALLAFAFAPFLALNWAGGGLLTGFYLPYLVGVIYLGAAVWVFSIRRTHRAGRAFSLLCASAALALGLAFDLFTTRRLVGLWALGLAMLGGSAISLALVFPHEDALVLRRPLVAMLGPILAALVGIAAGLAMLGGARDLALAVEYAFLAAALLFSLGWWLARRHKNTWEGERQQVRLIGLAALLSLAPPALGGLAALLGWARFSPYLLLCLLIFPLSAGVTVRRYRLVQADVVLSLGVGYGLMAVLVTVGYALLAAGTGLALGRLLAPGSPLLSGLIFFALAMALIPLREYTQRLVDAVFFRGKKLYQERLQTFSGDLTRAVDTPEIYKVLRGYLDESLAPNAVHLFVYDPLADDYAAVGAGHATYGKGASAAPAPLADSDRPTSDLRFPVTAGLVIRLSEQRSPLLLSAYESLPALLEADRARLVLLGAQAFVPLPGRERLAGWVALGGRLSGEPYTSMQMDFAAALCDQAALAIERAQVIASMENRVREMNLLTRVAQGINVTVSLDDILELVYAQTSQLIPLQHFRIMLYDRAGDTYQYAFFLEGDERLAARESRAVPAGHALEQEIIRQRRSILTADFNRECQKRGLLGPRVEMAAYLGVPLNAGSETIGALSLGSRDPAVQYSGEQQSLLQAIAGQVAGALVKARLLQETERRARQLSTLNEVTRQLTSTLETEPLLQSILASAVQILGCAGGLLLLVDMSTGELVVRAHAGKLGGTPLNRRYPAGSGAAGQSVQAARPLIVNDARRYPEWFSNTNMGANAEAVRAALLIPLMVKDRVTGVIEVINKADGALFTTDDQDLLAAFAAQAAVAIENARLYTNTDQALSARVEELSVMQRIDRELNASLDTTTAMRITLDWAMRQSRADAGLVGVLQDGGSSNLDGLGATSAVPGAAAGEIGVRVMASQGYSRELDPYQSEPLPAAAFQLLAAIQDGLPSHRVLEGASSFTALLDGGRSQAILPIRRETNTIGLLLLESARPQPLSDEAMTFLTRLSDHASIAISNAQLYAAVQQANLAKSDFVSFVAHELKNPMTSVKGYTELVAAGAVGPVTEAQANFLGTIRSNIERMNTLVSDLNDMSKIEVGRLRLDFKSLRLPDALESVVRSTRKQIEEKQQALALAIPEDLPPLWADRIRLEQVLVNLISNAHKYTPTGGAIEISAAACRNTWDPNGPAEVVHVQVKDNGIGISEDDQKKIFQKFFRSEDPKTREATGTGLGLNITRSLVEMQGGKIWFESTYRQGTTFHFTVPVAEG